MFLGPARDLRWPGPLFDRCDGCRSRAQGVDAATASPALVSADDSVDLRTRVGGALARTRRAVAAIGCAQDSQKS